MRVVAIIQARLTSSRLPGKVLLPIGPCAALWHTIVRTRLAVSETVVAIPDTPANDRLAIWLSEREVPYWRGPEEDVLLRYQQAAAWAKADAIVRITGDCPFVDPEIVSRVYEALWAGLSGYASNVTQRSWPRGLDVEAFTAPVLATACRDAVLPKDREHVTPWMRRKRPGWRMATVTSVHPEWADWRWVLDTFADYDWLCALTEHLEFVPPRPTLEELLALFASRPDLIRYEPKQPTYR